MRADFRELEKNFELEKTNYTVQLQQQYDQVIIARNTDFNILINSLPETEGA